jgi:hypothetical protein
MMIAPFAPLVLVLSLPLIAPADTPRTVTGRVFLDRDADHQRDPDEPGLAGVGVSNGREVVSTDEAGLYRLPIDDDEIIFVIKPHGYMCPVDACNIPRFFYVHKPSGSPPDLEHPGVAPTGPLPRSVDFPLSARPEPGRFRIIVFGDPQPRDVQEVNYLTHDLVPELIGTDAAFGVSLGDVAFDDLSVYGPLNAAMSTVGIPWYSVHGNHDENYDVTSDELADETWERVYGPPTFSFNWGPVHFIVLDDVMYDGDEERGRYHCELTDKQLAFIENDLAHIERDRLIVLMMHIPLFKMENRDRLFALLEDRPHTFSLAAHWHEQWHEFYGPEDGWHGAEPHHHLVHGTACGSWWAGAPDEFGIPHATMADGAPNGYSIITFDGYEYSVRFKAAHRPAHEQMHIHAPDSITTAQVRTTEVLANIYAGSERSVVEMKVGDGGEWVPMKRIERTDPYYEAMKAAEASETPPRGRELPRPAVCRHLWTAPLPANLPPGAHVIRVRAVDMFGQRDEGTRVIRIEN